MNLKEELSLILETDPLGLLDVKPRGSSVPSADTRLAASFKEILDFVKANGGEPTRSTDVRERQLFSRLKSIRQSRDKVEALRALDEAGLLNNVDFPEPSRVETIDDVLNDSLGLLTNETSRPDSSEDIFILKNIPLQSKTPDFIAKRQPCNEFDRFEPIFREAHKALQNRTMVTRPFNSQKQIRPGSIFILNGMLVYVGNQGTAEKTWSGHTDARLYCVFENGTESNLLLLSLAGALWQDSHSRQVIDANQYEMFQPTTQLNEGDRHTGFIYVLKSKSKDPEVSSIQDLYKIGFSTQRVERRIQDAEKTATYLFQDVEPVAEFATYNLNPLKFEQLLHRFFAEVCLDVTVSGFDQKVHSPREWFVAPLHVIAQAIEFTCNEEITQFKYDPQLRDIVRRPNKA